MNTKLDELIGDIYNRTSPDYAESVEMAKYIIDHRLNESQITIDMNGESVGKQVVEKSTTVKQTLSWKRLRVVMDSNVATCQLTLDNQETFDHMKTIIAAWIDEAVIAATVLAVTPLQHNAEETASGGYVGVSSSTGNTSDSQKSLGEQYMEGKITVNSYNDNTIAVAGLNGHLDRSIDFTYTQSREWLVSQLKTAGATWINDAVAQYKSEMAQYKSQVELDKEQAAKYSRDLVNKFVDERDEAVKSYQAVRKQCTDLWKKISALEAERNEAIAKCDALAADKRDADHSNDGFVPEKSIVIGCDDLISIQANDGAGLYHYSFSYTAADRNWLIHRLRRSVSLWIKQAVVSRDDQIKKLSELFVEARTDRDQAFAARDEARSSLEKALEQCTDACTTRDMAVESHRVVSNQRNDLWKKMSALEAERDAAGQVSRYYLAEMDRMRLTNNSTLRADRAQHDRERKALQSSISDLHLKVAGTQSSLVKATGLLRVVIDNEWFSSSCACTRCAPIRESIADFLHLMADTTTVPSEAASNAAGGPAR